MRVRTLGEFKVNAIGLGCMNLSHAYGTPPDEKTAETLLLTAFDSGVNLFDTAALYGFGANETLVGRVLKPHRKDIVLTSKCGMQGVNGVRVIDGRAATIKQTCEDALRRLQTDVIDLYYLHRLDKNVPIEDSVGALADLVREGKIRNIGLSEMSAATLRRACAVHPIAAMQTEYSLWTRNAEIAVLAACRELGVAFVAFSPVGRGFLAGGISSMAALAHLAEKDIRRGMPRFYPEYFEQNLAFLTAFQDLANSWGYAPASLALAWLLHQSEHIIPIPGTTRISHLLENLTAADRVLSKIDLAQMDAVVRAHPIAGARYNDATQREIDTEN
ncbi:General stress protein 69 [Ephemeroptericola cinctiostellae]|uniref:General stress protein 69 n=1 Tax=Ephemeroptericola cinctiostellae TaxID=2268024 RepID=A0A345D9Y2_9BURK|nr:aldo/keto reductase [Ephemeroptericola cinctiostellae]AXF85170.1 General stress protein 69 [Ephemeroptericola cinctiostellae]